MAATAVEGREQGDVHSTALRRRRSVLQRGVCFVFRPPIGKRGMYAEYGHIGQRGDREYSNLERVTSVFAGDSRSPDSGERREGLAPARIQACKNHPGKLLAVEDEISPFVIEGSCRSSSNDFVDVLALMF